MFTAKRLADLLTTFRAFLGVGMVWVGLRQGQEGLAWVARMLITSWMTDLLDGAVARRRSVHAHTWIGDHDLEVDIFVSLGVAMYLFEPGYMSGWLCAAYLLGWIWIGWHWGFHRALGMLAQAPIYGGFIWITWQHRPGTAAVMLGWILAAIVLTWPRFPDQIIPGFLEGMRTVQERRSH